MDPIDNGQDIIDSRDVIERVAELTKKAEDVGLTDEERDELDALADLASEAEGYTSDWVYGEALIRDSYFEEYARELADDIGAIDANASWPLGCIDWERAASELQQDYTSVDFDGVTYWTR